MPRKATNPRPASSSQTELPRYSFCTDWRRRLVVSTRQPWIEPCGGSHGGKSVSSVLPRRDGVRDSLHALDDDSPARACDGLDAFQRIAARDSPDVAGTLVEAAEGIGSSGPDHALVRERLS